jgi:hypothetical protein
MFFSIPGSSEARIPQRHRLQKKIWQEREMLSLTIPASYRMMEANGR